jgi:DNA-binding transcriptional ArsR family regulator
MSRLRLLPENHLVDRIGWLRAAVLGANDRIISTASLIVGVAAAASTQNDVLIAGVARLVAGAMSMAAGKHVLVSSQSDTEQADLDRERAELANQPAFEREEPAQVYVKRGVGPGLARQVADQLMAKDARVQIVQTLLRRTTCIGCDIVKEIGLAASTTSEHLRILKEAGLIIGEIERPRVCYSLNAAALKPLAAFLDRATAGLTPNERG